MMSYRECEKKNPQCKGLKKGVKGYKTCIKDAGCGRKSKTKAPPLPSKLPSESALKAVGRKKRAPKLPTSSPFRTPWLAHIADTRRKNPSLSYKDAMVEASKTYKKGSAPKPKSARKPRPKKETVLALSRQNDKMLREMGFGDLVDM